MGGRRIGKDTIRISARRHGQGFNLPAIVLRQAASEAWVRLWRRAHFRADRNDDACRGYEAMTSGEFAGVNARQRWANWRTIPLNLDGALPDRPVTIIDLCSGIGDSTEVLAWYAPPDSRILGLEFNPGFAARAAARAYRDARGRSVAVAFRVQSVLEEFRGDDGTLAAASVDVVNSSGAVGCHFAPAAAATLAREVARVLRPGGLALIDAGAHGTDEATLARIFSNLGFTRVRSARSCLLDRYVQVCFRARGG
jgi:SAM-dependent methyltransferase